MDRDSQQYEVIVVGAGQAGLAIGYFLRRMGRHFAILEAEGDLAAAWRGRWDSLKLFTPARYDGLPGHPFPGHPWSYPMRDDVVDYLTDYARRFDLPVELNSRVRRVARNGTRYVVELDDRRFEAEQVVIATGPFQVPYRPAIAEKLDPVVFQTHSTGYRTPETVPGEPILVVGGGNTGYQIAAELAATRQVHIAIGTPQKPLPQRILGRDLFWYLDATGLIRKRRDTRIGRRLQQSEDTLIGSKPSRLRRLGVRFHGRASGASGTSVTFADGTSLEVASVIWATGFRIDHAWIDAPVFDDAGRVGQRRGVTDSPGLYFLGMPWMHTRGSALLGFVKDDAEFLASRIAAAPSPRAGRPTPSMSGSTA